MANASFACKFMYASGLSLPTVERFYALDSKSRARVSPPLLFTAFEEYFLKIQIFRSTRVHG